jgi:hypothetical protein
VRIAPVRSAGLRCAPVRIAPVRFAAVRSAYASFPGKIRHLPGGRGRVGSFARSALQAGIAAVAGPGA